MPDLAIMLHGLSRSLALLGLLFVALATSACGTASWPRWFYDIGDNYACQQGGAQKRDAQARASQCADPQHPDRRRYEDYEAARNETLKQQP